MLFSGTRSRSSSAPMIQRSLMRDWSFLAPDLIQHVGDLLLATSDVDGYMGMRAVCRGWRSAVADPRTHAVACLRFRPRNWAMLEEDDNNDKGRLFVDVSTGRFFRRRLPQLRGQALVGASDGLLVLADRRFPFTCRVLNPWTGQMLPFFVPIAILRNSSRTVAVAAGSDPVVLFAATGAVPSRPRVYGRPGGSTSTHHIAAMVAYAGRIYLAYTDGSVFRRVGGSSAAAWHGHDERIIAAAAAGKPAGQPEAVYLVESAGELLLVLRQRYIFSVFRVDVERKALEPATSIGGRALFLGRRCLSVAADKFPNIEGDCLYYATPLHYSGNAQEMYEFKLRGGWESLVSSNMDTMSGRELSAHRPLSIAMVFHTYCLMNLPDVKAQFM